MKCLYGGREANSSIWIKRGTYGVSHGNKIFFCPFYLDDSRLEIRCENGQRVRFRTWESRCLFVDAYCASMKGWTVCSMARMLSAEWEGERKDGEKH